VKVNKERWRENHTMSKIWSSKQEWDWATAARENERKERTQLHERKERTQQLHG